MSQDVAVAQIPTAAHKQNSTRMKIKVSNDQFLALAKRQQGLVIRQKVFLSGYSYVLCYEDYYYLTNAKCLLQLPPECELLQAESILY
jgi:hypothetical protein